MTQPTAFSSPPVRPPEAPNATRPRLPRLGGESACYRMGVAVRAATAIVGGYLLAALCAAVLALALPMARLEAAVTSTLLAFVVYPCAVMGVFAARSAARAVLGLLLPCTALAAVLLARFLWGVGA